MKPRSTAPRTAGGAVRHPGELARLRAEPDLAATAIDELLRFDTPLRALRTLRPGGHRSGRRPIAARFGSGAPVRIGKPGSGRVQGAGSARIWTRSEPACVVRGGHPLLPGGAARADGIADRLPHVAAPLARPGAARDAAVEAHVRASRRAGPPVRIKSCRVAARRVERSVPSWPSRWASAGAPWPAQPRRSPRPCVTSRSETRTRSARR